MDLLADGPERARRRLVLAHGAGAPMDSEWMEAVTARLADAGIRVFRFEFPYMAGRRPGRDGTPGKKRPPDRAPVLEAHWRAVLDRIGRPERLVVGGKSMGGRIASQIADDAGVRGLVCLGYPFHPPGRPERLRTAHLATLATPTLIVQGERDPFGTRDEVDTYDLSEAVEVAWMPDGNHDLAPRKASGFTLEDNLDAAAAAVVDLFARLRPPPPTRVPIRPHR